MNAMLLLCNYFLVLFDFGNSIDSIILPWTTALLRIVWLCDSSSEGWAFRLLSIIIKVTSNSLPPPSLTLAFNRRLWRQRRIHPAAEKRALSQATVNRSLTHRNLRIGSQQTDLNRGREGRRRKRRRASSTTGFCVKQALLAAAAAVIASIHAIMQDYDDDQCLTMGCWTAQLAKPAGGTSLSKFFFCVNCN
jgi:hypothetical protein